MKEYKVLEVLDCFYPCVDGPINIMVNVSKKINEREGWHADMLVPDYPSNRKEVEGVKIYRSASIGSDKSYKLSLPKLRKNIRNLIRDGGYDLVHIHSPFVLGKFALKKAKKYKVPTIVTVHTKYREDFEKIVKVKPLVNFCTRYIMRVVNGADYVTTVSDGARQVINEYGFKGSEIRVVPNGTDLPLTKISEQVKQEIIEKYGLKDKFVFLFVGRLVENKNIHYSLEILKRVKEAGVTEFKFLIVGSGSYQPQLLKLVKKYDLVDNVVFTGRVADRSKLSEIYGASDLFLFPSTFDTCGIVAIEASANYLPSAMLENTCASERVINGQTGFVFPYEIDSWVNGLIELIKSGRPREIKEQVAKDFYINFDTVTDNYMSLYREILEKKDNK